MTVLHTASFYQPANWAGRCFRVSRSHPRGRTVQWETLPFFYPERATLKAMQSNTIDFEGFSVEYLKYLDERYHHDQGLQRWMQEEVPPLEDLTLLCFEPQGKPCHRLVLAGWMADKQSSIVLGNLF